MRLSIKGEIVQARLRFWPAIEYEARTDQGGVVGPEEPAAILRNAGIMLVSATARERELLRRHGFRLPESRGAATVRRATRTRRSTAPA